MKRLRKILQHYPMSSIISNYKFKDSFVLCRAVFFCILASHIKSYFTLQLTAPTGKPVGF